MLGKTLPSMAPCSSTPAPAVQNYGLSPAAGCQTQMSVVSDLEIRLAGQIWYLELSGSLNTVPEMNKTQARLGGNMRRGFKSPAQHV